MREPDPQLTRELERVEADVRALVVCDHDTYMAAGEVAVRLARLRRQIEAFFAPLERAARQTLEAVRARKREWLGRVVAVERDLDAQLVAWRRQQREAERARDTAAVVAALTGEGSPETAMPAAAAPAPPPSVAGLSYRRVYEPVVEDLGALVRAAAEDSALLIYLEPKLSAIRETVRQHGRATRIPGVAVVEREVTVKR